MNKKSAFGAFLLLLLISMLFSTVVGTINLAKADSHESGPNSATNTLLSCGSNTSVTVDNITSAQSFVQEGFPVNLTATVENVGESASSSNLTFYCGGIALDTQTVTVAGGSSTVVSFVWNTTGFALGNYTLSTFVWPLNGEPNLINNNSTGSTILVTCPGDLNGHYEVDFQDITTFVSAYINYYQTGQYYPAADFDHDRKLTFNDLQLFVAAYLAYWVGPTPFVTNGGLTLTMSLEKNTYTLGEPVNFTLSINNVSNQTISFSYQSFTFDFMVFNATGIVYRYSFNMVQPMWVQIYSLAPGASLSRSFEWDQECNLNSSPFASPPVFLASPGTYWIIGEALGMQTVPYQIVITSA